MKIRNKNTGAEYSSATLMKQGMSFADPVDVKLPFFTFAEGWEEVKNVMNEIVINGVHHVLVKYDDAEYTCYECSLRDKCNILYRDDICTIVFKAEVDEHFEIRKKSWK